MAERHYMSYIPLSKSVQVMKIKACVAERHYYITLLSTPVQVMKIKACVAETHYYLPLSKSRKLGLVWQKHIIIYPCPSHEN